MLGSGLRGKVDAMDPATAAHIQDQTVAWDRNNYTSSIQTNVIYAIATKSPGVLIQESYPGQALD